MASYGRRGFRVRLILDEVDDFRKKCYFFVNVFREKHVETVIRRIWDCFYTDICSSPNELMLSLEGFYIPPSESTFVLREDDVLSVRRRPPTGQCGLGSGSAASRVRSAVAPLTADPGTLVESVALVLQRLQDGAGPDDSADAERRRLLQVAEMMAAKSISTDVSTDDEGVKSVARELTSEQEVERLSQKMVQQATPPPPCAARRHGAALRGLTLTEVSRELRRRYEAARRPPPAADGPAPAQAAAAAEDAATSTPLAAAAPARPPADVSTVLLDASGPPADGADQPDHTDQPDRSEHPDQSDHTDHRDQPPAAETPTRTEQQPAAAEEPAGGSAAGGLSASDAPTGPSAAGRAAAAAKRPRSPSSGSDSSDSSSSSSEEDVEPKSTPARPAAGPPPGTKKKTRTRRRRGKKRPEPPPPPPPAAPAARDAEYAQRHGLPRADIDRYKRWSSVSLGWQTRPRNRRVVFDDDGNAVPADGGGGEAAGDRPTDHRVSFGDGSGGGGAAPARSADNAAARARPGRAGALGAGLLPRAFMRPRRCVEPPKRSEVLPAGASARPAGAAPASADCDQVEPPPPAETPGRHGAGPGTGDSASAAAAAAAAERRPAVSPLSTVVVHGRGRAAPLEAGTDVRSLLGRPGRQPLLVVRSGRALPGRAPYVELTQPPPPPPPPPPAEDDGEESAQDGDVYTNVSVVLKARPLEMLSPAGAGPENSDGPSADSDSDSEDAGEPADSEPAPAPASNGGHGCSVDAIANCNVVNAVGQSRRLEKQRQRGQAPAGADGAQRPLTARDENYYSQFPVLKEPPRRRDIIAFKCWDMDEKYNPYVSGYKEATVLEVAENGQLTLQLLEYEPRVRRRGRFEISSADDDEIVDLDEEAGIVRKAWSELFQPRLLHP